MTAIARTLSNAHSDAEEWQMRCDMAAVFRVAARLGWNEQIGNHNSLMLPGDRPLFLINPRGMLFQEITASSLIVCDLDGNVVRGKGELRKVAFHIHARIHLAKPEAACIVHVHPQYLTALSMLEDPEFVLAHHDSLMLNDRVVYDRDSYTPAGDIEEGDRLARVLGDKSVMVMAHHGVTTVGRTVHEAFDECYIAERNAMYQITALSTGRRLRAIPDRFRKGYTGPWGDKVDSRMHLDAWRRVLDRDEPDYAT
ncbi:MAG: class II aldolase/adducin family protein [Alphaproteobacteria bacterium]|nr:class II aldolase/adducin family protein [Alphaproteobacteria bacterium]